MQMPGMSERAEYLMYDRMSIIREEQECREKSGW